MSPSIKVLRSGAINVHICRSLRALSTASAIERGIRRSRGALRESPPYYRGRDSTNNNINLSQLGSSVRLNPVREETGSSISKKWAGSRDTVRSVSRFKEQGQIGKRHDKARDEMKQISGRLYRTERSRAPVSMPFTTSASEFLYGTSVVEAALASSRRRLYKLYVYAVEQNPLRTQVERLLRKASTAGVEVKRVSGDSWLSLFDKMSRGRPHNGLCLEVSPIKRPSATKLLEPGAVSRTESSKLRFEVKAMSMEERGINGYDDEIKVLSTYPRQPFVLLVDGVVDTGNLGGILRSAHFLGADAVAISASCGQLNPVVLKASAGAAEVIPLISVPDTAGFVDKSKESGWKVFASVAPPKPSGSPDKATKPLQKHLFLDTFKSPLEETPCILMIGGEGEGLKNDLRKRAHYTMSIGSNRASKSTVDSLNVSVATGILLDRFLKHPQPNAGAEVRSQPSLW